ncbi:hypothetical protein [Sphingomonas sp. C3-2]|uniref:hypothetical protein n=1 Tax=Sphingomonas sp. C3-2 TaxID=3062169 RepID=UPI00294AFB9D|nr:hypothetical protein [Sphingomonas sp. C3-2]WOK36854.1 hypothetical protein QYC26_01260 [Sphingomonas sp. C3-2]
MLSGELKPIASLSSGLLARKGQAKPAMRPQGFSGFGSFALQEDLGWNDMGVDADALGGAAHGPTVSMPAIPNVLLERRVLARELDAEHEAIAARAAAPAPTPAEEPAAVATDAGEEEPEPESTLVAPVLTTGSKRAARAKAPAEALPLPTIAISRLQKAAATRKGKAAFTLRLDPERHLKLRLACAISRDSAQSIVTQALDSFLENIPDLEGLVRHVPERN